MILKLAIILCGVFVVAKTQDTFESTLSDVKGDTYNAMTQYSNELKNVYRNHRSGIKTSITEVENQAANLMNNMKKAVEKKHQNITNEFERNMSDIMDCYDWESDIDDLETSVLEAKRRCNSAIQKVLNRGSQILTIKKNALREIKEINNTKVPACIQDELTEQNIPGIVQCLLQNQENAIIEKSMAILIIFEVETTLKHIKQNVSHWVHNNCDYPSSLESQLENIFNQVQSCNNPGTTNENNISSTDDSNIEDGSSTSKNKNAEGSANPSNQDVSSKKTSTKEVVNTSTAPNEYSSTPINIDDNDLYDK